jgi:hypothetical protein
VADIDSDRVSFLVETTSPRAKIVKTIYLKISSKVVLILIFG